MPLYNDNKLCQKCGVLLSDLENGRIKEKQTLRYCDPCWEVAKKMIAKAGKLWAKI